MGRIYLDHTATTPLDPSVFEAMKPYFLTTFGNASSIHQYGQEARAALDESRDRIARSIGASAGEVFFVSSGTEADNFALKGAAWELRKSDKSHIITSEVEHHAVLDTCRFLEGSGFTVTHVGVDRHGMVDPDDVRRALRPSTGIVSIMHANNEVGTINPILSISEIAREHGALFHTDAVQSFGKLPLDVRQLGVDILSLSAHKIYGPKGMGALYIRKGVVLEKFMHGGGQERGRRAGTENVPLAVGFAQAVALREREGGKEWQRLALLKSTFCAMITDRFPQALLNGHPTDSLPHIVSMSFDSKQMEIDGEALLFNLDLAGIAVSSGSACTSGSIEPSHVLLAMGRDEKTTRATIRFSMGRSTSLEEIEYTVEALQRILGRMGKLKLATLGA